MHLCVCVCVCIYVFMSVCMSAHLYACDVCVSARVLVWMGNFVRDSFLFFHSMEARAAAAFTSLVTLVLK